MQSFKSLFPCCVVAWYLNIYSARIQTTSDAATKWRFPNWLPIAYTSKKELHPLVKYNLILMLSWLLVVPASIIRLCTNKDTILTLCARFAVGMGRPSQKPTLWCHAASIGEFHTLQTLLPSLKNTYSDYNILVTTSNIIAFARARTWTDPQLSVSIAPLDFRSVMNRFLKHWMPIALITIENELFPNRTKMVRNFGAKVVWINARISEHSFKFWQKHPTLTDQVFSKIDYVFAQDNAAFERFRLLGISDHKLEQTQNLKKFCDTAPVSHPDLTAIQNVFQYTDTLCAASTHPGEDEVLLDAYAIALKQNPSLKLILVPRHPKRAPAIKLLMEQRTLSFATRSGGELPQATDHVYLADTIGELPLWYTASATTFVAGSILPIGGHTPFEPAAYGSSIIHGPYFSNFQDIYTGLQHAKGSIMVSSADEIATAWETLRISKNRNIMISNAKRQLLDIAEMEQTIDAIIQKTATIILANDQT